ncbi:TPA: hypothetical protein NGF98_000882 [Enterococcus faecalis]|uniref:Mom family adenine methylcarbamoylation protein n=1 Tax=Enterococcus TaxID=1350 RepID=UPI00100E4041|nr:hypothetical protein [Enterococcus faecalis]EHG5964652.1 hypothetical protein [Enterococcus faecalis]EHO3023381.1 hypothetical protein [Enterococcus faecalis]EHV2901908.1 hypothetical protein [Enterococcus faecalis]EJE4062232.1 hypothetical protein [Enterococcus faecalis]EKJ3560274.1 hypothetical protein [Enterococcus faecalis]
MRQKLIIKEIQKNEAIEFIRRYHYSKVIPRLCKYFLGIFCENKILGVVELGWGTQPLQTIRKLFPDQSFTTRDYLEIGKMCFLPEMNQTKYFGSLALSCLIQWMKGQTNCLFLYTLADGIEGKCGYVYQAANFYYGGYFKTSVYREKQTLEKIHPRSARILLEENAQMDGVQKRNWLTHEYCEYKGIEKINGRMFRYLYPLTKKASLLLEQNPLYIRHSYPKQEQLLFEKRIAHRKYEVIEQPTFNKDSQVYFNQ